MIAIIIEHYMSSRGGGGYGGRSNYSSAYAPSSAAPRKCYPVKNIGYMHPSRGGSGANYGVYQQHHTNPRGYVHLPPEPSPMDTEESYGPPLPPVYTPTGELTTPLTPQPPMYTGPTKTMPLPPIYVPPLQIENLEEEREPIIEPSIHDNPPGHALDVAVTIMGGMQVAPGMRMPSCERIQDNNGQVVRGPPAAKPIRRRDYKITYYGSDERMQATLRRMTSRYASRIAYFVLQKEICPTTLRPHFQMYIEFYDPEYISVVKSEIFEDPSVHIEIRLQPRQDAMKYCKKIHSRMHDHALTAEENQKRFGPWEFGKWRDQGTGGKLRRMQEAIADGMEVGALAEEEPETVLRHLRSLQWLQENVDARKANAKDRKVNVRVFVGPTGSGKTHLALEEAMYYCNGVKGDVFMLSSLGSSTTQNLWFDGYRNNKVLVIDDYDSWVPLSYLLRLLDKYPCTLNRKGGTLSAVWTEVWITSNKHPSLWTDAGKPISQVHMDALMRRINWLVSIPKRGEYGFWKSPHPPHRLDLPTVEPLEAQEIEPSERRLRDATSSKGRKRDKEEEEETEDFHHQDFEAPPPPPSTIFSSQQPPPSST